ncbi:hypothetical protein [Clostridioides difficile]|uniref:hypothetical protein n=1 Tax=Clostridioides difficile TaxID=1496 RepID=UPI0015951ED0|nr:hypothetical protein [Clostridioides difficile]
MKKEEGEEESGEKGWEAINNEKADRIGDGEKIKEQKKEYNIVKDKKRVIEV